MRLAHRLLLYALAIVGILVVAVVLIIDQRLHARIIEQTVDGVAREAKLLAVQWNDRLSPDSLADAAGGALGHRVTLIDHTGVVVGDSEFDGDALRALENHSTRPEVVMTQTAPVGSSRRLSPSAGDEELYVAVKAPLGVARVSLPTTAVEEIFERTRSDILLAGAIAVLIAVFAAIWFSRSVSRPIEELSDVAKAIADGELSRRPALSAPGEVGDLATALHRLAEQLGARMTALNTDRALLSAIVGSLEEGVLATDSSGRVVQANDAARRFLDVTAEVPFSADLLPRDPALRDSLSAALGGSPRGPIEISLSGRTLLLTVRPLERGGVVMALFDLTALRRLETVRRDFVANVSHELRTPLTVIAGFTETLAEDGVPAEKRKQFADMIMANTTRMQRIVDDLLDLSRIESGGWVPNPALVDVESVVREAMNGLRPAAETKGVALELKIDPGATSVYADRTALQQILSNLLENAIRYTARGSVTISTSPATGGVNLSVSDTGTGIAAEHLHRIFERFYRADPGRARDAGGTGLGLAIVRHLVESHGGHVEARSSQGAGTTINLFFPTGQPAVTAASSTLNRSQPGIPNEE